MAEIKSAIELAMERTKNLVMDDKEKRVAAERDLEMKVKTVMRRFTEGMLSTGQAEKEFTSAEGDPGLKRQLVLKAILDEINLDKDNSDLFELLSLVGSSLPAGCAEELEGLRKEFLQQKERTAMTVRERVMDRLRGLSIRGDALEPNVEAWPEWQEGLGELAQSFEGRLSQWKEKVLSSLRGAS
jgi:hypothetical protein